MSFTRHKSIFYQLFFIMSFISLSEIHFSYPASDEILYGVNAIFYSKGITAIVGDNSCGKSTLLKIIAGETSPDSSRLSGNATTFYMPQSVASDNLSDGQRQWRAILHAFESGADILLLDEPTNNLDINFGKCTESIPWRDFGCVA